MEGVTAVHLSPLTATAELPAETDQRRRASLAEPQPTAAVGMRHTGVTYAPNAAVVQREPHSYIALPRFL